ncbi:hypothetical protein XNC1_4069 [Xenorhabdus nematophila ATCC 19061]|uniref:Uncharacterized protein n=1 Tax=Xenorhabdus nematophila (strain ATCC 19061 / DSM 3370 / CCUG 14189 / LMG 1036 / NCIMB 9965 / AN6) TaxID=406817 RepID=D3VCQ9_XENNA|nr:hypothetical protein XNC1_4069 [Xenorhabdus nematophila ATCC 19061]
MLHNRWLNNGLFNNSCVKKLFVLNKLLILSTVAGPFRIVSKIFILLACKVI